MVGSSDEQLSLLLPAAEPIPLAMREQFLVAAVNAFMLAGPGTNPKH